MAQQMSQTIEHLKRFLIIRLLAVMVFYLACEAIINLIVTRIMFPVFNNNIWDRATFNNQSAGKILSYCYEWPSYLLLTELIYYFQMVWLNIFLYFSRFVEKQQSFTEPERNRC